MNKYFKHSLVALILCTAGYVVAEDVNEAKTEETSVSIEDQIELSRIWAYDFANACTLYQDDEPFNSDVFIKGYDFYMENQDPETLHTEASSYSENECENFFRGACTASGIIKMVKENNPNYMNQDAFRASLIDAFNNIPLPPISAKFADHEAVVQYYKTLDLEESKCTN